MPLALIQSTVTPPEPGDDPVDATAEASEPTTGSRTRSRSRRKPSAGDKVRSHKLGLPDGVFARLELQAIKKGSTASQVAAEILDRNLPHHRIVTDD
jgi:hypothetical protein